MTVMSVTGPAGTLHVDDVGSDGMPVVFVHSYAGSSKHWAEQLDHLRSSRRALALDLRGHGSSTPPPDDDYSIESLAEDIEAVVDSLDLKRFVLVGHSLGAAAAIAFAGTQPGRVAGLVLIGAPGRLPAEQARQIQESMAGDYDRTMKAFWEKLLEGARPGVREQLSREMASIPKEASLSIIDATLRYDPLPALRRYPGPKLAVVTPHGDTPHDLHRLMPYFPHETIDRTSHWPHLDKPEEFSRLVDGFLADIK
jgi:pimeloyl-ACP methyl ester carboxylesterase